MNQKTITHIDTDIQMDFDVMQARFTSNGRPVSTVYLYNQYAELVAERQAGKVGNSQNAQNSQEGGDERKTDPI